MSKLTITITRAGLERFTAAQLDDDLDLSIAAVALTDADFAVAPTLEALPGEFRRIATVSGEQVGDNIVHMTLRDDAEIGYTARGFGLFLPDGTLFAVYGQSEQLFEKSPRATFLAAIDIAFPTGDVSELRFGNTDFLNPPATTQTKGVVELATDAEADVGTAGALVITAALLFRGLSALRAYAEGRLSSLTAAVTEALDGLTNRTIYGTGLVKGGGNLMQNRVLTVDAATAADVRDGQRLDLAMTPGSLRAAYDTKLEEIGWRVDPDGYMEIWGVAQHPAIEGVFTLNFHRPFTAACLGILTTKINTNQVTDGQTTVQEVSLQYDRAVLFVQNHQAGINEAGGFRWRAWGR